MIGAGEAAGKRDTDKVMMLSIDLRIQPSALPVSDARFPEAPTMPMV